MVENLDRAYQKLNLITRISTSNMNLFDAEGRMKTFVSPEQILKEFYPVRLECYEKRKIHKLAKLDGFIKMLDNYIMFINEENVIGLLSSISGDDMLKEMKLRGLNFIGKKDISAEPQNVMAALDYYPFLAALRRDMNNQDIENLLVAMKSEKEKELTNLQRNFYLDGGSELLRTK